MKFINVFMLYRLSQPGHLNKFKYLNFDLNKCTLLKNAFSCTILQSRPLPVKLLDWVTLFPSDSDWFAGFDEVESSFSLSACQGANSSPGMQYAPT